MMALDPAAVYEAWRPETGRPGMRFAARPADLDLEFADPDRAALACRVVANALGLDASEVAAWTLDRRVRALAAIALATFGDTLDWQARCPACGERMELELALIPLLSSTAEAGDSVDCAPHPGTRLRLRLPTGLDQQAWRAPAVPPGELFLAMAGALVESVDGRAPEPGWQMPSLWLEEVETTLAARDPLNVLETAAQCPACGADSGIELDLEAVILELLSHERRRAMEEVHRLAWTYHWSEAEVLAIPPRRRAFYLQRSDSER